MTLDALIPPATSQSDSLLRRFCRRMGGWCAWLVDTHHARIPF